MGLSRELPVPDDVARATDGHEALRAWVDRGKLAVSARPETWNAAEWGFILGEVFTHVVGALHEAGDVEIDVAIEELLTAFVTASAPLPVATARVALAEAGGVAGREEEAPTRGVTHLAAPRCTGEATEILRLWMVDDTLSVTLSHAVRGANQWGLLLAGLAAHVARELEGVGEGDAEELSDVIRSSFLLSLTSDDSDDEDEPED